MARLSPFSNPADAGLDAMGKTLNILNAIEDQPLKKKLLEQQIQRGDRELTEHTEDREFQGKIRDEQLRQIEAQKQQEIDRPHMLTVHSAQMRAAEAQEKGQPFTLTDDEQTSLKYLWKRNAETKGIKPDEKDFDEQLKAHKGLTEFFSKNQESFSKGGIVERGKSPEIDAQIDNLEKVLPYINEGKDKFGESAESGTIKKIKRVIINPKTNAVSFELSIQSPVKDRQKFHHISDGKSYMYPDDSTVVEKGNINLNDPNRKIVGNANGSMSSIRTITVEENGQTIILPTVDPKGNYLTVQEARDRYDSTGEHLGKFKTEEDAAAYDAKLHQDLNSGIGKKDLAAYSVQPGSKYREYTAPLTHGRGPGPQDPVVQLPMNILAASVDEHYRFYDMVNQARLKDPKFFEETMKKDEETLKGMKKGKAMSSTIEEAISKPGVSKESKAQLEGIQKLLKTGEFSLQESEGLMKLIHPDKDTKAPKTFKLSMPNNKVQDVQWNSKTEKWDKVGSPYDRHNPKRGGSGDKEADKTDKKVTASVKSFEKFAHQDYSKISKNYDEMLSGEMNTAQKAVIRKVIDTATDIKAKHPTWSDLKCWDQAKKDYKK